VEQSANPTRSFLQVYKEELCRRHYNSIFSLAFLFRAGTLLAAIILSLVVAFATDGFWKKLTPDIEQPTVHYTGDGLAILEVITRACLLNWWPSTIAFTSSS
jgi:hypothetical protein